MPRILVADDNSNIQKMVSQALHDTSIEIVGVSNGGAAIRALPETAPDLVLADVFMPVRNGYEVCDFIKHEASYSNIPVILLVGAFDPLDEHEAKRVSADGILKKPFVPPDPLVNMIKTLLAKAADERLAAVAVPVGVSASAAQQPGATEESPAAEYDEPQAETFSVPARAAGEHEGPLAFSSLLQTPAVEETGQEVTASRDPALGEPAFGDLEAADENTPAPEEVQEHAWSQLFQPLPIDGQAPPTAEGKHAAHVSEIPAIEFGGNEHEKIDSTFPPADETDAKVFEKASSLAKQLAPNGALKAIPLPLEIVPAPWLTESGPVQAETQSVASLEPAHSDATTSEKTKAEVGEPASSAEPEFELQTSESRSDKEASSPEPAPSAPWLGSATPIFPGSESLWARSTEQQAPSDAVRTDSELPIEVEAVKREPVEHAAEKNEEKPAWPPGFEPAILPSVPPQQLVIEEKEPEPISAATEHAAEMEETASLSQKSPSSDLSSIPTLISTLAAPVAESPAMDPELIEAVVLRIIDRMQPQVIEVVTREILRPLVEALVRREINKK